MTGRDDGAIETARQWLRYAEGDLVVAEHEMSRPTPVYHTVCFLCQSAGEKFVKGFLISRGWSLEKTHDLVQLLGWCTDYDADLAAMVDEAALLNEYIVAGRYPGDIAAEQIGPAQAREALEAAERIQAQVHWAMRNR
ncbi:HEPN domain-containing protein [Anaerobaca lacustris]|uniref:HEPN domain-containing protein n=1 Tax=Anaerobaca lacustris TaxID=3044600 RepID=A0AAW6U7W9_9BACT|nr:HEPN domain-containing protein [Sedimentisphaerales bacterium M17dextr]